MSEKNSITKEISSEVKANENATTSIEASLPWSKVEAYQEKALTELAGELKLDGFRPGKIPAAVAKKHLPEIMVQERAAQNIIADAYLPLLKKHEIDGIGQPEIQITKLAAGNPLEFTITIANFPKVDLADYKKITEDFPVEKIDPEISDEELENGIQEIRQQWARSDKYQALIAAEADEEKRSQINPSEIEINEEDLPEVNDEWAKKLGPYQDIKDFKAKFRENIKTNKAMRELEARQGQIISQIVEQSKFDVPELVYKSEAERLLSILKEDVKNAGLGWHQYLKSLEKTEDEVRAGQADQAKVRVHTQLAIQKIAEAEKLFPEAETVKTETQSLMKMYPKAHEDNLSAYVESQLVSNNVLIWLSKLSQAEAPPKKETKPTQKPKTTKTKTVAKPKKKSDKDTKK